MYKLSRDFLEHLKKVLENSTARFFPQEELVTSLLLIRFLELLRAEIRENNHSRYVYKNLGEICSQLESEGLIRNCTIGTVLQKVKPLFEETLRNFPTEESLQILSPREKKVLTVCVRRGYDFDDYVEKRFAPVTRLNAKQQRWLPSGFHQQ